MTSFAESLVQPGAPTHPDGSSLLGVSEADILRLIREKLAESDINLGEIGSVKSLSVWGPVDSPQISLRFTPGWEAGPDWPVIQPAAPVKISRPKAAKSVAGVTKVAIIPDPQVGYLKTDGGRLVPLHDPSAIDVAFQIMKDFKPDVVAHVGDFMDFAEFSTKFVRHPAFVGQTQMALDAGHRILARGLSVTPEGAVTHLTPGNHEKRLTDYVLQNAVAAFGLRRADEPPAKWPVWSVPNLLRLDDLGVVYGDAYPSGALWLREDVRVIHGDTVSSSGSSAATIAKKHPVSTIFGHVHRLEMHSHHWDLGNGSRRECVTITPGCLCSTDGAVPSSKSSVNHDGSFVPALENWNQGAAFLTIPDEVGAPMGIEFAHISNGAASYRGTTYRSTVDRFDWEY